MSSRRPSTNAISSFSTLCPPIRSHGPATSSRPQVRPRCFRHHTHPTSTRSSRPSPRSKLFYARRLHELWKRSKPPSPTLSKRSQKTNAQPTLQIHARSHLGSKMLWQAAPHQVHTDPDGQRDPSRQAAPQPEHQHLTANAVRYDLRSERDRGSADQTTPLGRIATPSG